MNSPQMYLIVVGACLLLTIIYRIATAKNRRMRAAFYRVTRVCDCAGTRRYCGTIDDKVEDTCNSCVRTRITSVADILDHQCADRDMVALGAPRIMDGMEVQDWRCSVCGEKHESCNGLLDTAMGGI